MKTIGLIDDHPLLRTGLAILLRNFFEHTEVLESENINQFCELNPAITPDLVIFGMNHTSGKDSLVLAKQLSSLFVGSKIIIYGDYKEAGLTVSYFKMGIHGCFLKQSSIDEFVVCIKMVMDGKAYLSPELFQLLLPTFINKKVVRHGLNKLTARESEIATYLNQGMKTGKIAEKLGRKATTISTIKGSIFKKMNVENVFELQQVFKE